MKQKSQTLVNVFCCTFMAIMLVTCSGKNFYDDDRSPYGLVLHLDSTVIMPYMAFGSSLSEVSVFMQDYYACWTTTADSMSRYTDEEGLHYWSRSYVTNQRAIRYFFDDATGRRLVMVSYNYDYYTPLEPIIRELERKGFKNQGELRLTENDTNLCYLLLSADERLEVQLSASEADGGRWTISFQPTDDNDLKHLASR